MADNDQNQENINICQDNFVIMSIFVRDMATIEEVEAINELIAPLNQAILQRLKPPGSSEN